MIYHLPEVVLAMTAINNQSSNYTFDQDPNKPMVISPQSDATFRLQAPLADFAGVWLDGQRLSDHQYTLKEGSIVVTLARDVVEHLSNGKHTLGIGRLSTHQIYAMDFQVNRPVDNSQPLSPPVNNAKASEAARKTCAASLPVGLADLFQIDRQGDKATLYFTPVNDNTDRYHVVFGHGVGDERFGGIAMQVSDEQNSGVLAIDIQNLDPRQDYSFHVAPVNDCAVGSWSNWLTAKAVGYKGARQKTYRYEIQTNKSVAQLARFLTRKRAVTVYLFSQFDNDYQIEVKESSLNRDQFCPFVSN